jgi:Ca2+/Na+ antiporter
MNGAPVAGAGFGAIVGATLVALGTRIGLALSPVDAATLGMAAVGVFIGIGHAVGEYGISGIVEMIWHGRPKLKAEDGLTLVEALVVLVIVAIVLILIFGLPH